MRKIIDPAEIVATWKLTTPKQRKQIKDFLLANSGFNLLSKYFLAVLYSEGNNEVPRYTVGLEMGGTGVTWCQMWDLLELGEYPESIPLEKRRIPPTKKLPWQKSPPNKITPPVIRPFKKKAKR